MTEDHGDHTGAGDGGDREPTGADGEGGHGDDRGTTGADGEGGHGGDRGTTAAADDGDAADAERSYADRLVDESALRAFLVDALGEPTETNAFAVERHREGHSNETLFVTYGDRELVVRRPPPGETAETAHDVLREYRVTDALVDTPVPVPVPVAACEDPDVIGSDFYVMERTRGTVIRDAEPERFATPAHRRRLGEETVDTLAAIHGVDPEAVGLAEFGRPEGFTRRQVNRWAGQFQWAFETTMAEREVPEIFEATEWLTDNVPEDHPTTLVHGDFKLDNLMFAPGTPPELVGVFDWELSTLGDPRTDLGWLLSFWRDPDDPEPAVPELGTTFTEREGYPTRRELVARWEDATGFTYEHDRFYRALAVYKLAALGEMFFRRHLEGNGDDELYPLMRDRVPAMAERCLRIVDGDEPL